MAITIRPNEQPYVKLDLIDAKMLLLEIDRLSSSLAMIAASLEATHGLDMPLTIANAQRIEIDALADVMRLAIRRTEEIVDRRKAVLSAAGKSATPPASEAAPQEPRPASV